jgi:hypothetical protein
LWAIEVTVIHPNNQCLAIMFGLLFCHGFRLDFGHFALLLTLKRCCDVFLTKYPRYSVGRLVKIGANRGYSNGKQTTPSHQGSNIHVPVHGL